jgi:hypothetical protein
LYFSMHSQYRYNFLFDWSLQFNIFGFIHQHNLIKRTGITFSMCWTLYQNALTLDKKLTMIRQVRELFSHPVKSFFVSGGSVQYQLEFIETNRDVTCKQEQTCIRTQFR